MGAYGGSTANTLTAYGVAKSKVVVFEQCFPLPRLEDGCFPVPTMKVNTLAEDGQSNLDGGDMRSRCVKTDGACGLCMSSIN